MKKALCFAIVCLLALSAAFPAALSEARGFGFVNSRDVALRRGIGGKTLVRVPENACVWIRDSQTDGHGVLWYEINAGLHKDHANVDYTGWMKAEFVDAGDTVWHDIQSVKGSGDGIIALRKDGTVESAGTLPAPEASDWTQARQWSGSLRDIRQVGFSETGLVRYALGEDGACRFFGMAPGALGGTGLRLAGGNRMIYGITGDNRLLAGEGEAAVSWIWPHSPKPEELARVKDIEDNGCRILLLMDDGTVFVSEDESRDTEPDWTEWTDVASLEASAGVFSGDRSYHAAYAAVRKDGTVLAAPEELAALTADWTGMVKVEIGDRWALGLRQDGTVLSAGFAGATPPDVSGWKDIVDIGTGHNFCVGIRKDGTAVFDGDYLFMREGHTRK